MFFFLTYFTVYKAPVSSTSLELIQMHYFNIWVIFHCVYVPQLSYPFICWWTSRLLPFPSYCNSAVMNIGVHVSLSIILSSVCMLSSGIAGLYRSSEKAMAPHSSTLAWKIPCMEEPGRLQSMGSLRWTRLSDFTFTFSLSCIGEGNGNPLLCSCLENPRDGGAWWAAVYGVTQSRTRLKWLSSSSSRKYLKHCQQLILQYQ